MTLKPQEHNAAHDECGASAVEYSLLVVGIAAVLVTIIVLLGSTVAGTYQNTCTQIAAHVAGSGC
jgi:Flp pilus assembly pilin Flp